MAIPWLSPLVVVLRVSTTSKSYKRVELYVIVAVFIDQQCKPPSCYCYVCWLFFVTCFGIESRSYKKVLCVSAELPNENISLKVKTFFQVEETNPSVFHSFSYLPIGLERVAVAATLGVLELDSHPRRDQAMAEMYSSQLVIGPPVGRFLLGVRQ